MSVKDGIHMVLNGKDPKQSRPLNFEIQSRRCNHLTSWNSVPQYPNKVRKWLARQPLALPEYLSSKNARIMQTKSGKVNDLNDLIQFSNDI